MRVSGIMVKVSIWIARMPAAKGEEGSISGALLFAIVLLCVVGWLRREAKLSRSCLLSSLDVKALEYGSVSSPMSTGSVGNSFAVSAAGCWVGVFGVFGLSSFCSSFSENWI